MKAVTFNRKSWHYWLATKIGTFDERSGNFCSYIRNVLFGMAMGVIMLMHCLVILYVIGRLEYSLYSCQISGLLGYKMACTFGLLERTAFGVFSALVIIFLFGFSWVKVKEYIKARDLVGKEEQSFAVNAYRSFKEKICLRVDFK